MRRLPKPRQPRSVRRAGVNCPRLKQGTAGKTKAGSPDACSAAPARATPPNQLPPTFCSCTTPPCRSRTGALAAAKHVVPQLTRRSLTSAASTRSALPGAYSVGRASRLRQKWSPRLFPPESDEQIRRQPPRVTALMHGEGADSDGIIRAPGVAQDHAKSSSTASRMPPNHQSAPFNCRSCDRLRAKPPPRPRGGGYAWRTPDMLAVWVSLEPAAAPLHLASRPWRGETAGASASRKVAQPPGACGQTTSARGSTVARVTGAGRCLAGVRNPVVIVR